MKLKLTLAAVLRFNLLLLGLLAVGPLQAHMPGQSYLFLSIDGQSVSGRVEITLGDLNRVLELGLSTDGSATMDQVLLHRDSIDNYILNHIAISHNGETLPLVLGDYGVLNTSFARFVRIYFRLAPLQQTPVELDIENKLVFHSDQKHLSLLVVENNWESGLFDNEILVALTFSSDATRQRLDLSGGSVLKGLGAFIKLGMHHIWMGADHILFLLALLLPSVMLSSGGRWTSAPDLSTALIRVVKIVTVFTLAHSITLSLAALQLVNLDSRLVESIIAVSIGIAALHILLPRFSPHAFWIILIFGLFHGFGFAGFLSEMQIPERYLLWSLLGFNLGVEIGQLVIVVILTPLLFFYRKRFFYTRALLPLAATGLMMVSLYWFIERAFNLDFRVGTALRSMVGI